MLLICRLDYSVIARYAKVLAIIILGISSYGLVTVTGGMGYYIPVFGVNISQFSLLMLYVPLYGAVIYRYYGAGYGALTKSFIWMMIPVLIAMKLPNLSLAVLLLVSMSVVLMAAIALNWFQVSKRRVIVTLWGCEIVLPAAYLASAYALREPRTYQMARLQAFLTGGGDANYMTERLRANFADSKFLGDRGQAWTGYLPDYNSDFIFSYLISTYGIFIGVLLCCILAFLIFKIFAVSFRQKNQLGMCMGCGCGMILLLSVVINIGENIGILPITTSFLPFFSAGGSNLIMCYILIGIILSIYRYKNIYPSNVRKKSVIPRAANHV